MNARSIKRLRRKFIIVAGLSFFTVIGVTGIMSVLSINRSLERQADLTITRILDSGGSFSFDDGTSGTQGSQQQTQVMNPVTGEVREVSSSQVEDYTPRYSLEEVFLSLIGVDDTDKFSPEYVYGARYFTVSFDTHGNVTKVDINNVASVTEQEAIAYAQVAQDPRTVTGLGQINSFYYREGKTADGSMVVFLDCTAAMLIASEVTYNTLFICMTSLAVTLVVIAVFSSRAIRPEVENARSQEQFITNASHELKTPLAVIRANTEVTQMISGETEWTESTMRQVDRMDGLIQNLVMIARSTESESDEDATTVNVTDVVRKSVDPFKSLASQSGLTLTCTAEDDITMRGTASSIQQLVTLLVDNAIKYCDEGGSVSVDVAPRTRGGAIINVTNSYAEGADVDLDRFFDRFYREDEAHSNQKGYGIGLSVVESICRRYKGSIKVGWANGDITFTCVLKHL